MRRTRPVMDMNNAREAVAGRDDRMTGPGTPGRIRTGGSERRAGEDASVG